MSHTEFVRLVYELRLAQRRPGTSPECRRDWERRVDAAIEVLLRPRHCEELDDWTTEGGDGGIAHQS